MTNEELDNARAEEAWNIYNREHSGDVSAIAARLAREGWTPPVTVDPDIAEAWDLVSQSGHFDNHASILQAIKRGRALAAAEAKPGMVWVKHDGSKVCPIDIHQPVLITNINGFYAEAVAGTFQWHRVTHYAVITPPMDDVA